MTTPPPPPCDPAPVSWRVWLVFGMSCMVLLSGIMFAAWVLYAYLRTHRLPGELDFLLRISFPPDISIHHTDFMLSRATVSSLSGMLVGGLVSIAIRAGWCSVATLRTTTGAANSRDSTRPEAWSALALSGFLMIISGFLLRKTTIADNPNSYAFYTYTFLGVTFDHDEMHALRMILAGLLGASITLAVIGVWWSISVIRRSRISPTGWDPSASEDLSSPSTINSQP